MQTPPASRLFEPPVIPGIPIGKALTLVTSEGQRAVFMGATAIYVFNADDKAAEAAVIASLSWAGLASGLDIARGFGCHRNTVSRLANRLRTEGMASVVPAKGGPKGPHKVTATVRAVIAAEAGRMGPTALSRAVAERTGVLLSTEHVRRLASSFFASAQLQIPLPSGKNDPDTERPPDVSDPRAPVVLPVRANGRYMGLSLYYPALSALSLLEVARSVFSLPRSERFGVRAVVATLFFMTLLSKTTLKAGKHLRRVSFGAVVGCGRAPSVKTLRRKLAELVTQNRAAEFGTALARRWVQGAIVATAYLYVDGHMKAYTGKRRLAECWNSQRRMPLPGINTYHVADGDGRPVLFLTEELSTNLAKAMPRIIEAIREVVRDRVFTVIFDRGGYDAKLFTWLSEQGIGFITYQRANPSLSAENFSRRETRFEGRRVRFYLATDEVCLAGSGPWRRVVIRMPDGHQTPILTSLGPEIGPARIACLMIARWRQENFFKYMGNHHGLDSLISYAHQPADPETLVPNPERKQATRLIAEQRKKLSVLKAEFADALLREPEANPHDLKIAQGARVRKLEERQTEIDRLIAARKQMPTHVPVASLVRTREVMRLEAKSIVDRIKISAYNAEEWLLDRLVLHYPNPHDARDLLRAFAELSGEIDTTDAGVLVTLEPPDLPIHRRALRGLVDDLNTLGAVFPGTDTPVTYRVGMHHSEAVV